MTDPQLLHLIVARGEKDPSLSPEDKATVVAALLGDEALQEVLDGGTIQTPKLESRDDAAGGSAYLQEIEVQGFRGIGAKSSLPIEPKPGLTLVLGRNGSGKSSFAEGLEFLLTGDNLRWSRRKGAWWKDGWKNLHLERASSTPADVPLVPTLKADFMKVSAKKVEEAITLERRWAPEGGLEDHQLVGSLEDLGWNRALEMFRPFLSYNELGSMLDEGPSKLFDALANILGLGELSDAAERLRQARLTLERAHKKTKAEWKDLQANGSRLLEAGSSQEEANSVDPRLVDVSQSLQGNSWNNDKIANLTRLCLGGSPDSKPATPRSPASAVPASPIETFHQGVCQIALAEPTEFSASLKAVRAAAQEVAKLEKTESSDASKASDLLRSALAHYQDNHFPQTADCPICGTTQALTTGWAKENQETLEALEQEAEVATKAKLALLAAGKSLGALLPAPPSLLKSPQALAEEIPSEVREGAAKLAEQWQSWLSPETTNGPGDQGDLEAHFRALALCDHLKAHTPSLRKSLESFQQVVAEAAAKSASAAEVPPSTVAAEQRDSLWNPFALKIAAWLPEAQKVLDQTDRVKQIKQAEVWLRETELALYNERFEPIKESVRGLWEQLRTESHVSLDDIRFEGRSTKRRVELDVTVDGTPSAALGVMSQGELHSLALCLFLPRATLEESPFRFLVIDDPVQAMDPQRVDGLARVLDTIAKERQVLVFSHDERLPEAIRRMGLTATILQVERKPNSEVSVVKAPDFN